MKLNNLTRVFVTLICCLTLNYEFLAGCCCKYVENKSKTSGKGKETKSKQEQPGEQPGEKSQSESQKQSKTTEEQPEKTTGDKSKDKPEKITENKPEDKKEEKPKTKIENLGGINGLTATLENNKIYLYYNNAKFMESSNQYSGALDFDVIKNVNMIFSKDNENFKNIELCNKVIDITMIIESMKIGNKEPIRNILEGHQLMLITTNLNKILVIDLNSGKIYVLFPHITYKNPDDHRIKNGEYKFDYKHYFNCSKNDPGSEKNYFWREDGRYGFYICEAKKDTYWAPENITGELRSKFNVGD